MRRPDSSGSIIAWIFPLPSGRIGEMNVTLHENVELYVKRLVDSGAFPSAESAVNSLVAQLATSHGSLQPLRYPGPIGEIDEQPEIPVFPRGVGVSIVLRHASTARLPDLVGLD